jgi:hypothetical protein
MVTDAELAQVSGFRGLNPDRELGRNWPASPPLTDAERDEVQRLMDKFADEHEAAQEAHLRKIQYVGTDLGRRVARGELLLADAQERLDRVLYQQDADCVVPLAIVLADIARDVAIRAFEGGVRAERASPC